MYPNYYSITPFDHLFLDIQKTLRPPVQKHISGGLSLEIDPTRLEGFPNENLETNLKALLSSTQMFLDSILNSVETCPRFVIII
jgi:hypothetical protein